MEDITEVAEVAEVIIQTEGINILYFWRKEAWKRASFFLVRPARTYSNGCKSPNRPDSGKVTAKNKGVYREVESEGSLRQTSGLTDRNPI